MKIGGVPLFPQQADTGAAGVDMVALVVCAICGLLALGVLIAVVYFLIRYRAGSDVNRDNPPESHLPLELSWVGGAVVLSLVMFFFGARAYYDLRVIPTDSFEIEVVGRQWMWKIRHPSGRREINTLHVPLGVKIKLKMISRDVIHSFYLPEFRTKHDVLPGRYTDVWIEPTKLGRFTLACSEYCGTDHSRMKGEVIVVTPEEYESWQAVSPLTSVQRGERLYRKMACHSCHDYQDGQVASGAPLLHGIYGSTVGLEGGGSTKVDDDYLRRSILRPNAQIVAGFEPIMPTYEGRLSEEELLDLIAYIQSRSGSIVGDGGDE